MASLSFKEEADACRRQALAYVGRPEGSFLLRAAAAFEELARRKGPAKHEEVK